MIYSILAVTGGTVLNRAPACAKRLIWASRMGASLAIQSKLPQENAKKFLDVRIVTLRRDLSTSTFIAIGEWTLRLRIRRALHEHRRDDGDRCRFVGHDYFKGFKTVYDRPRRA